MIFRGLCAVVLLFLGVPAIAQDVIPAERFLFSPDTDFPGGDTANLFDTTQDACMRACQADASCAGFTFNARSNACFPKSLIGEPAPYSGAVSARKLLTDTSVLARAGARVADMPFLSGADLDAARAAVRTNSVRFPAGLQSAPDLAASLVAAQSRGDFVNARIWAGYLAALTDSAEAWTQLSFASLRLPESLSSADRRRARQDAIPAALNGVLRATSPAGEANALAVYADALERNGRGRDMIQALRRAYLLTNRQDLSERLDKAINTYGFRITDHEVQSDSTTPRLCATFSESLVQAGADYDAYVRVPDTETVAQVSGSQLCLDGVQHGQTYNVTFRSGLPAESGETLARDVDLRLYVRDRSPSVRFPGRGYVLPRLEGAALPVETVNAGTLDLRLSTVSDRNLMRALQENFVGRPLSQWEEELFTNEIGAEVWSGTADVATELNKDMVTRLPLADMLKDRAAGIYALSAQIPGADPYDQPAATQWFVISNLGLTSFQGSDGLHVAVRDLSDTAAKQDVQVSLISKANGVLGTAITDADGFAHFDGGQVRGTGSAEPALLVAQSADDLTFLALTGPAFDLSDRGVEGRPAPGPIDIFLATDRGIYRAGETIGATALVRDDTALALPDLPLTAVLFRPDGAEYSRSTAQAQASGGHVFSLPLGASVPRGTWRLDVGLGDDAKSRVSRSILVEDFLPERLKLELAMPGNTLQLNETPRLTLQADYLFGTPAADLPVEAELRLRPSRSLPDWPGFQFGRQDTATRQRVSYADNARTDATGAASLFLTFPEIESEGTPLMAEVVARVSEGSGRPVERRLTRAVSPGTSLVGIKPQFEDSVGEGQDAAFQIMALTSDGAPLTGQVRWTLNRVETRYQWYQLYGNWNWEPSTRRTRIATGEVTLAGNAKEVSAPVQWGSYELVVETLEGSYAAASVEFYSGWYGQGDSTQTPDRLQVGLDRPGYAVGETARFRITTPAAGSALVSVLATDVIHQEVVAIDAGETVIPLEVTAAWGAGAYVTASVLRPVGDDDPAPTRAMGLAHAAVAPAEKALDVSISAPDVTSGQAGITDVTISVAGAGTGTFVTLAAVDQGIHNLTAHAAPDVTGHYFGQRRLGVELRDLYGRLIDGQTGALGRVRSGGDAGAQMKMQSPPPTEEPMVFFSGLTPVGPDGTVTISVPRPAFNGNVRLDAIAWNPRSVGQDSTEVIARDPVVLTASLPRFLAPGDQSRLLLEFVHADGATGDMALAVRAPDLITGLVPATVLIRENQKTVVEVPVTARDPGNHEVTVELSLPGGAVLTKTLSLGVRQNDPVVAKTQRLTLSPGETLRMDADVFAGLLPSTATASLTAGPLARFNVPGLIQQLDRYPYGCTEQLTSGALPLLYLSAFAPDRNVQVRVDDAVARILTRQTAGGSFGLWRPASGEFWLDAYVTDFLTRASDAGYAVPARALASAQDNLRNRINYAPDFEKGGTDIAYALLVLSRSGAASMADLRYYADAKKEAFATPRAAAQLGAALANYGDTPRADQMFAQAARLLERQSETRGWRTDFGSNVSDTAAVLRLARIAGSSIIDANKFSARLTPARALSTQDAAQVLLAAHALQTSTGPSGLELNGLPQSGPVVETLVPEQITTLRNTGQSTTDVTLTTFGVPQTARPAGGYGYALSRAYFTPEGVPHEGPVRAGDQFVVVLTITPFESTQARLMLDDPLPAGLEIDNPNLVQSGQVRTLDWLKPAPTQNAEFLSDRFRVALDVRGTDPVRVAYKVRAVTPGSYHHPAAEVHDMYRPEYRAITETGRWTVQR